MRTFVLMLIASLLCISDEITAEAAEFKILEITQKQVDALELRGRRTARTFTYKLSADGSHVVGNTADVWWLWTDQEGFNFPYLHESWLILDVSHNGDQLLLADKPVDTKVSPHGIAARYAFLFDETQTGYRSDRAQRLKPMQSLVEGKISWLRSKGGNPPVQQKYLAGVQASALSANGQWVVGGIVRGRPSAAQTDAFRWSQVGGYELLPRPPGVNATTSMLALHTSGDGRVITGRIADEAQKGPFGATHKMFVWFADGNRTVLVDHLFPKEDPPRTRGIWVSGDGKTIIGRADQYMAREGRKPRSLNRPFVWSEQDGIKPLDRPWHGTDSGGISAISHDGSIMVGHHVRYATNPDTRPSFTRSGVVWQNGNANSAESFLRNYGLNTSAWRITNVIDVSADGQSLIGSARSVEDGRTVGWLARLGDNTIQTPSTTKADTMEAGDSKQSTQPIAVPNKQPPNSTSSLRTEQPPVNPDAGETTALPEWEVLGFWNYDAADALFLPAGLHLVEQPGNALGENWQRRLEMKEHARLPNRQRSLWPVYLNREEKQVCAPYPGYPSYNARIELPRDNASGTYQFSGCTPGR